MPSAVFELAVPAIERLQNYASDGVATCIDAMFISVNDQYEAMEE